MKPIRWTPAEFAARVDDVLAVYAQAMGYTADAARIRRGFVLSHVERAGFRAVATVDNDNRLLGFAYGYMGAPGQWWHDQVHSGLPPDYAAGWLQGCFELVELHVIPQAQGNGLGEAQLLALLDGAYERTVVLSTPEVAGENSRAWRLYRRWGFMDVLRQFRFTGDERPFAILGRALPLY